MFVEDKDMFSFTLIYHNISPKIYVCESEEEYNKWVDIIRTVTGYEDLKETYELREQLGEGKYGKVKLCIHKESGRETAIKILSKKAMRPNDFEQVHSEVEILKVCQHPNIIKLYDVLENQDYIYISNFYNCYTFFIN